MTWQAAVGLGADGRQGRVALRDYDPGHTEDAQATQVPWMPSRLGPAAPFASPLMNGPGPP